jgi:nucleoid DNA-binding protein
VDITAFIRELLFGHDCVIVPGFGGFIGNYTPARIDRTNSTFYPPVKQISFNRNLNHNDGLLIGRISESVRMNYGDVRSLVDEFVEDVRKRLSKGEKVVFDHIGSFVNNHEGNIQFEPDQDSNYYLNSYGLTSFQVIPLEGYDVRKRIIKHADKEPVRQVTLKKYLWRAAVIIPLLGVMIAVPLTTNIFKTRMQTTTLNPLASVELEKNIDSVERNKNKESLPVVQPPAVTENTVAGELSSPVNHEISTDESTSMSFCIITGSFRSEDNAVLLMKKLEKEGYKPELINGPNGFFRVSAFRCSSLDEATRKKDSIGMSFTGAWIARIK